MSVSGHLKAQAPLLESREIQTTCFQLTVVGVTNVYPRGVLKQPRSPAQWPWMFIERVGIYSQGRGEVSDSPDQGRTVAQPASVQRPLQSSAPLPSERSFVWLFEIGSP